MRKLLTILFLSISLVSFSQRNIGIIASSYSITATADTIGRVNFTTNQFIKSGWTNIQTGYTGTVSLSYSVTMNVPTINGAVGVIGPTGVIWPDSVATSAWYLYNSANNKWKLAFSGLSAFDSVKVQVFSSRSTAGSNVSYFKWQYNGTGYSIDSYLNTSILTIPARVCTGTDTFYMNNGTGYAYLNGMKIIGYTH
jgi:hypothetical protein